MWIVAIDPLDIRCPPVVIGPFDNVDSAAQFQHDLNDKHGKHIRANVSYLTVSSFWWMKANQIDPMV